MSGLAVRPAAAGDLDAVAAIGARPFAAGWSRAALAGELGRDDAIFLVVPERGYALARVADGECRLLDLAAAADGGGVGRALLSALARAAKARGCAKVTFEASAANARALSFYAKAGAKVVGRRPKFYYDGSDAVLMDLDIP
ncbi:MAG: GNAT family N-acetyltransferase [Elusimicrobia bacterium]|nr:GNAT family N-acetyltransferase [Elusimicrobiota bacterium]